MENIGQSIDTIRQLINTGLSNINSHKRYKNSLRTILSTEGAQNAGLSNLISLLNNHEDVDKGQESSGFFHPPQRPKNQTRNQSKNQSKNQSSNESRNESNSNPKRNFKTVLRRIIGNISAQIESLRI